MAVPEVVSPNSGSRWVKFLVNPKSPEPHRNEPPKALGR